jgi:hypothetical protein
VFIVVVVVVVVCLFIDSVRKLRDTPSYNCMIYELGGTCKTHGKDKFLQNFSRKISKEETTVEK